MTLHVTTKKFDRVRVIDEDSPFWRYEGMIVEMPHGDLVCGKFLALPTDRDFLILTFKQRQLENVHPGEEWKYFNP